MNAIYGFLVLVALGTVIWIVQSTIEKGIGVARKAANQNILYRSEHKEGQDIVAQPVTFQTTASIAEVMDLLLEHVTTADDCNGATQVVYETSRSNDRITYAFGNLLHPRNFEAVVALTNHDGITEGTFAIVNWFETNGLIREQYAMKKLRRQVQKAFELSDTSVEDNEDKNSSTLARYCPQCGSRFGELARFCPECGSEVGNTQINSSDTERMFEPEMLEQNFGYDTTENENEPEISTDTSDEKNIESLKMKKNIFGIIGSILGGIAIIKMMFIGYYPREQALYFGMLIVGLICFYIYSKIRIEE